MKYPINFYSINDILLYLKNGYENFLNMYFIVSCIFPTIFLSYDSHL